MNGPHKSKRRERPVEEMLTGLADYQYVVAQCACRELSPPVGWLRAKLAQREHLAAHRRRVVFKA